MCLSGCQRIMSTENLLLQLLIAIFDVLKVSRVILTLSRNNLHVYKDDLVLGSFVTLQENRNNLSGRMIPWLSIYVISIL